MAGHINDEEAAKMRFLAGLLELAGGELADGSEDAGDGLGDGAGASTDAGAGADTGAGAGAGVASGVGAPVRSIQGLLASITGGGDGQVWFPNFKSRI